MHLEAYITMSLVFATTFFFFFFFFFFGCGGGGGTSSLDCLQTDFEFEISGSLGLKLRI